MANTTGEDIHIPVDVPLSGDQRLLKPHGSKDLISVKAASFRRSKDSNWRVVLSLAFQSIGIVYGDIGTSPLYTYTSTFGNGIKHKDDVLGVLCLVFYTLTLLPPIKYVFIVLRANNNGEGGTFALYSQKKTFERRKDVALTEMRSFEPCGLSSRWSPDIGTSTGM